MNHKIREISKIKNGGGGGSNTDKYHTVRLHLFIPHFQTVKKEKTSWLLPNERRW